MAGPVRVEAKGDDIAGIQRNFREVEILSATALVGILHFMSGIEVPTSQKDELLARFAKLRSALKEAGERFED